MSSACNGLLSPSISPKRAMPGLPRTLHTRRVRLVGTGPWKAIALAATRNETTPRIFRVALHECGDFARVARYCFCRESGLARVRKVAEFPNCCFDSPASSDARGQSHNPDTFQIPRSPKLPVPLLFSSNVVLRLRLYLNVHTGSRELCVTSPKA